MMNTKKREFGLIIIFLFLAISFQAAVLRGSVTDKVTNEPLIGAVIQISGTTTGAITDFGRAHLISVGERGRGAI